MSEENYPIKPLGKMVLIEFVEVPDKLTTKGGLIIENPESKQTRKYAAYIRDVGNEVDVEQAHYKIGDKIIFNEYDLMPIDVPDDENVGKFRKFGLIQEKNIFGLFLQ